MHNSFVYCRLCPFEENKKYTFKTLRLKFELSFHSLFSQMGQKLLFGPLVVVLFCPVLRIQSIFFQIRILKYVVLVLSKIIIFYGISLQNRALKIKDEKIILSKLSFQENQN